MFSHFCSLKVCSCMYSSRNMSKHHNAPAKCLPCMFNSYFYVRTCMYFETLISLVCIVLSFLFFYLFSSLAGPHEPLACAEIHLRQGRWTYSFRWVPNHRGTVLSRSKIAIGDRPGIEPGTSGTKVPCATPELLYHHGVMYPSGHLISVVKD